MCGFDPPAGTARRTTGVAPSWNPPPDAPFHIREQLMSTRKLSRLVGFLFVLAVMLGGVGTASAAAVEQSTGSATAAGAGVAATLGLFDSHWT